jgi:hypothetical protein
MTELPDEIAIGYSTWRLLELILLGIIMTLLCGAIVFLIPLSGMLQLIVGCAGVAFFGAATCVAVWKLLSAMGPVLFINRTGIRDLRILRPMDPLGVGDGCCHHESSLTKVCRVAGVTCTGRSAVCHYL